VNDHVEGSFWDNKKTPRAKERGGEVTRNEKKEQLVTPRRPGPELRSGLTSLAPKRQQRITGVSLKDLEVGPCRGR